MSFHRTILKPGAVTIVVHCDACDATVEAPAESVSVSPIVIDDDRCFNPAPPSSVASRVNAGDAVLPISRTGWVYASGGYDDLGQLIVVFRCPEHRDVVR